MVFQKFFSTLQILMCVGLCFGSFEIILNGDDLSCKASGIQCINDTSFTVCMNFENFTILTNIVLHCPDSYYCDTSTNYPCVDELPTTTQAPTTTTDPTTTTTTDSTTTTITTESTDSSNNATTSKTIVPRPTGAPTCTTTGLWPAPSCSQYYECVENTAWVFWKYYTAVLRTCADGEYYDTGLQQCIEAELSDCAE